ncbi:glycosyl hydrolase family 28-related protein [Draconibacterium halophilum]|uniref:Gluconolaconase n=1 Tax=Draconibacterium halophilum TaxID=2706887 RepID=A0A6C0RFP4_9BACT|nr:glycosyl hydrolase family 28-related protein [Draconibacterium halophilum]QIA08652.1 gluconolaconase [Draconibacterium halophilum]
MKLILLFLTVLLYFPLTLKAQSVYTQMPDDPEALYFTSENYDIASDGKHDVSDALQKAINKLKKEKNFGILFIPEGKYLISKTIYVPKAIRLIGYGKNRPEFILGKNTPAYQDENNYMFWFTDNLVEEGRQPRDAGAGTFYSAISNINFRIEKGNPKAIALRTHFAQHSFVSHCNFYTGDGYAGIYDLGNEIEDLKFYGGEYGISTARTSPGWPMMMIDLYFEGQRSAAIISRNTGMTIVSMHVKDAPVAVELQQGVSDRLFMEDCLFEKVKKGVVIGVENETNNQINLLNIACNNVDIAVYFSPSETSIVGKGNKYLINNFVYGLVMDDMSDDSEYKTVIDMEVLDLVPEKLDKLIPDLPPMDTWVNVKDFGAVGDGKTDDTQAIKEAIAKHKNVYLPSGWYRVTEPLKLNKGNALIGLHPFATQLVLAESEANFSGFGSPVPVLESSERGDDIINGIGIKTGGYNNRAVGLKWMASEHSMINDVKFVGGHGTMAKPGQPSHDRRRDQNISSPSEPVYSQGMDLAWDNQYWSLWVTNNGGGTLKDIWTANTYASAGLYISNTATPGKIYAMSLEHHVRQEARFNNVANWDFYAFQFEEEGREGKNAQTLNFANCNDLMFANFWMYRTIRVNTPRPWGVKVSNSQHIDFRNMRSWTQVLHLPERTIFDMDKNLIVYPGDFARVTISGKEKQNRNENPNSIAEKLGFGYEFATGAVSDSKGNVYFCENQQKRVYRWSAETNTISIYADYPYKPFSLAVDTEDNLIVICRYNPQPGFVDDNQPKTIETLPDNNPYYSGWGNGGWASLAYAINPDHVDDMQPLQLVKTNQVKNVERVIHPTHRWRENFKEVATGMAETSFVAPDGVTIIPNTFDLGRSVQLMAVSPKQIEAVYVTHEDPKITYRFQVDDKGMLTNRSEFVKRGEYSNVVDSRGNLYLAEGEILVFNNDGNEIKRISLDERVHSMTWGGKNKDELFVTTSTAFYRIKL